VEDIKGEYLRSAVNIAPVRFGAGTPNKIIEALALGIPTVATRLTVSGFDYEIQKYISIVDTPELFAEKIIEIFNKAIEYKERMKEASEAIVKLLDRRIVVGRIEKYLAEKIH
jgi:glycosyltransferase involved in cell wall biosynthesis